MKSSSPAPITDAELEAVRALAAQGRPIPDIVMAAILKRIALTTPAESESAAA